MPKLSLLKKSNDTIWLDKGVHAFLKGISLKVNIIVWLEIELAYFKATVQHFSHYVTRALC